MCILSNRHIKVSPQCPICKSGSEDIRHLVFTCTLAREVWKSLGLEEIIDRALCTDCSGSVVLEEILQSSIRRSPVLGQLGLQETVAVGAWYIWWERRQAMKGETVKNALSSVFAIQAIAANHVVRPSAPVPIARWQKPPMGHYKLNIDASFFDDGTDAVAAVLRNYRGEVVAGASELIDHIINAPTAEALALRRGLKLLYVNAPTAEALALRRGLKLLYEAGCSKVAVESDCLELIDACNGNTEILSPYAPVLADCFQLAHAILSISFSHCPREANGLAHFLARFSFDHQTKYEWVDAAPNFLLSHVLHVVTVPQS